MYAIMNSDEFCFLLQCVNNDFAVFAEVLIYEGSNIFIFLSPLSTLHAMANPIEDL